MIDSLLSLPTVLGGLIFIALTTAIGMTVYYITFRLHAQRQNEAALKEIKDATGNLFRVVGWLFTLLLSITFTDVVTELGVTETAIQSEAAAIEDARHDLRRFGFEETGEIHSLLIDYTQAVIDHDWSALSNDQLSVQTDALLQQLGDAVLGLEAKSSSQEIVQSRLITDVDRISNYRISRLQQARERPSSVLIVVLFGYLVTMVYFGIYEPRSAMLSLLSLYTVFVGVIIYLMLAMGDPFHGTMSVDPAPLEYVLQAMQVDGAGLP
jgi:hypothetical protein